jgi:hypothetical protein
VLAEVSRAVDEWNLSSRLRDAVADATRRWESPIVMKEGTIRRAWFRRQRDLRLDPSGAGK